MECDDRINYVNYIENPDYDMEGKMDASTKFCPVCGENKPLEKGFYKSLFTSSGYEGKCKDCKNKQSVERRKAAPVEKQVKPVRIEKKQATPEETQGQIKPDTLVIDFKDHPELYQWLCERSKEDFRTPEMEILYVIAKMMENEQHD